MENSHDFEVLSPLAAVVLFGRSGQAVRLASRQGRVRTETVCYLERHAVRLIELSSAIAYWGKGDSFESRLEDLRRGSFVLEIDGFRYCVLHPPGLIRTRPFLPGTSETWFQGDKE